MPKFTKKYMIEDYERLYHHADLLEHYLWDTQAGAKPDATEKYKDKNCDVRVQLYRAAGALGGYVVIKETLPNIWRLDDAIRMYQDNHSEHTLGIRVCLERLRVARGHIARGVVCQACNVPQCRGCQYPPA